MYVFSFWSTFKSVFKSILFRWNAQCITVDGRPKRSEMFALSNDTRYCRQGQKVIRISLFQGPRCNVRISWKMVQLTRGECGRPAVTVIWASQRFGHPHSQNSNDTGIPCNPNLNPNRKVMWEGDAYITRVLGMGMPISLQYRQYSLVPRTFPLENWKNPGTRLPPTPFPQITLVLFSLDLAFWKSPLSEAWNRQNQN